MLKDPTSMLTRDLTDSTLFGPEFEEFYWLMQMGFRDVAIVRFHYMSDIYYIVNLFLKDSEKCRHV